MSAGGRWGRLQAWLRAAWTGDGTAGLVLVIAAAVVAMVVTGLLWIVLAEALGAGIWAPGSRLDQGPG